MTMSTPEQKITNSIDSQIPDTTSHVEKKIQNDCRKCFYLLW